MGRAVCDPFDATAIAELLISFRTTRLHAYRDYASEAARPYARSSFEGMIDAALKRIRQSPGQARGLAIADGRASVVIPAPHALDEASDAYWSQFLSVKSSVVTTISDATSISVRGNALIVKDGETRLVYEASVAKPQAIVMTGWAGNVTIEALRFACDHKITMILLDWNRDFLSIVGTPAKQNASLIRAQVACDRSEICRAIVASKIAGYVAAHAMTRDVAAEFLNQLDRAGGPGSSLGQAVAGILAIEAQAARAAWPDGMISAILWRSGSPRVPASWKLPYSTRGRRKARARLGSTDRTGRSNARAVHPVNALLNVAFAVTVARLTANLNARGLCPAIGFLHSDKPGRWSLAWDAIEPLRPLIESRVFRFVKDYQFGSNDFILSDDGHIRLMDNLLRVVIAETTISGRLIDGVSEWLQGLITRRGGNDALQRAHEFVPSAALVFQSQR